MDKEELIKSHDKRNAMFKADLLSFASKALSIIEPGENLIMRPYLMAMCCCLENVAKGKCSRQIINIPPRHLKSLMTSIIWVAWVLARRPNAKIAILSYDDDLARIFAVKVKRLISSEWYLQLAPNVRLSADNNRLQDFSTTAGGVVLYASVESGITGRGFDFIILDDPQSALQAYSRHKRNKLVEMFKESIISRLNRAASGALILVQQRLHVEDLTGVLLGSGKWNHLCLPLQATEEVTYLTCQGEWVRPVGDVLAPELIPHDSIAGVRSERGDRVFYAQYQQAPTSVVGQVVKPDELREVEPFTHNPKMVYTLSIDPAAKASPTSDWSALLVIASDGINHFIVDQVKSRGDVSELRDIALSLVTLHGCRRVLIEDSAAGPSLKTLLGEKGCNANLLSVGGRDKVSRLEDCRLFFSERRICVFRNMPWTQGFIEDVVRFPDAEYDDVVDALSLYLNYILKQKLKQPVAPYAAPRSSLDLEPTYSAGRGVRKGEHPFRPANGIIRWR